jgi:outer membrane lipoprotein-sorting protein
MVSAAHAETPDATELLRASDRSRGGIASGITWVIDLQAVEDGETSTRGYIVKAKGDDALAEATAPPRNKGEVMLFNDRTIWFVKPGLRKPVSISARQRLSGEAANGDIASTNYARDYEGAVVGEETVNGQPAWKLELKAKAKNVTYDRIRYWIAKDRKLGVKAEFLTVSGEVFKAATFEYGNKMTVDGVELDFVSKMTITDASQPADVTTITFREPKAEAHPANLFNINNVGR